MAISAILGLVSLVGPVIIKAVEKKFGAGKGAEKKAVVVDTISAFVKALGDSDGASLENLDVPGIVELLVQILKTRGELDEGKDHPAGPIPLPDPIVTQPAVYPSAARSVRIIGQLEFV